MEDEYLALERDLSRADVLMTSARDRTAYRDDKLAAGQVLSGVPVREV